MEIKYRNSNKEIFAPLKNAWLVATPEEIIRQKTICRLVNDYGYDLKQMEQDLVVNHSSFKRLKTSIIVWKTVQEYKEKKNPLIVIHCLANDDIIKSDYVEAENYALLLGAEYFTIHSEETKRKESKPIERVFKFSKIDSSLHLREIAEIPNRNISNDSLEINITRPIQNVSKEEFKNVFLACHDVIRNNDKFSPEMAFDEISKVLFMKIKYERENGKIYTRKHFEKENLTHQEAFETTKVLYKLDRIFEEKESLRIKSISFLQIIEKLEKYNLSEVPEDIKGVAFEEFLGKTFRGDLGQFFTPRTLVDFMVSVLNPQEKELICDPCCGSGGFLIESFKKIKIEITNHIRTEKQRFRNEFFAENFYHLEENQQKEILDKIIRIFTQLEKEIDTTELGKRLNYLSDSCIYGTDAEPRSARTAKMNMFMQGDGHSGVHHRDGLVGINGIFKNRFDVILTNPPFGARISKDLIITEDDLKSEERYVKKYGIPYTNANNEELERYQQLKSKSANKEVALLDFFTTSKFSTLTEVAFIERCLDLLRKGGRMGVVLPEGFLNGSDLQNVRDYVEGRAKLLLIVSVPQDVFVSAGASVKSSLVFLKKFTEEEENLYKNIKAEVEAEIEEKYREEVNVKSLLVNTKAQLTKVLKELNAKKKSESKAKLKERFDYEIAVVQVEKAGISSTGQVIDNELVIVNQEFTHYREINNLWQSVITRYEYRLDQQENLVRNPPYPKQDDSNEF